jgi:hypothetical protein
MSACVGGFSTCRSFRPVNLSKMVTRTRGREAETLETAGDAWDGRRDMLRSGLIGLRQGRSGSSLSSHGMLGFQPNAWFPASPLTTGCVVFDELLFSSFFSFFSLPMPPFQKKKKCDESVAMSGCKYSRKPCPFVELLLFGYIGTYILYKKAKWG